uniref:Uncharacterized protein n=1 Tax=Rhizophora mucronata TaxID=61149 RepID=A0A2P2NMT5_RHIMU
MQYGNLRLEQYQTEFLNLTSVKVKLMFRNQTINQERSNLTFS